MDVLVRVHCPTCDRISKKRVAPTEEALREAREDFEEKGWNLRPTGGDVCPGCQRENEVWVAKKSDEKDRDFPNPDVFSRNWDGDPDSESSISDIWKTMDPDVGSLPGE